MCRGLNPYLAPGLSSGWGEMKGRNPGNYCEASLLSPHSPFSSKQHLRRPCWQNPCLFSLPPLSALPQDPTQSQIVHVSSWAPFALSKLSDGTGWGILPSSHEAWHLWFTKSFWNQIFIPDASHCIVSSCCFSALVCYFHLVTYLSQHFVSLDNICCIYLLYGQGILPVFCLFSWFSPGCYPEFYGRWTPHLTCTSLHT